MQEDELRVESEKEIARIKDLCREQDLELNEDLTELLKFIVNAAYSGEIKGIGKLVTRDWVLTQALRRYGELQRDGGRSSTIQRAFEHVCELAGHGATGAKSDVSQLVDVVIDAVPK